MTRLAVFAYNFPHKKTQDFILRLLVDGHEIVSVIASNPETLNIPAATLRVKPRHVDVIPPEVICARFGIPYVVLPHNSNECADHLRSLSVDVAVIAGARILKPHVIACVPRGIINFHPGILPNVRGLDALQWSLHDDHPLGVTAHVINEKVDRGRILLKKEIPIYDDDNLIDLSLRLYETQMPMLTPAIEKLLSVDPGVLEPVEGTTLYRKMPPELEAQIPEILNRRKQQLRAAREQSSQDRSA